MSRPAGWRGTRQEFWPRRVRGGVLCALAAFASVRAMADEETSAFLVVEQLEYRVNQGDDLFRWDLTGSWGSDRDWLLVACDGNAYTMGRSRGDAELHLLYGHLLADFLDVEVGLREDFLFGPGRDRQRTLAEVGLRGLTHLRVELTGSVFVSQDGEASARLQAETELEMPQNFVAKPRFELNVAFQNAERYGIRSGATDLELALRVRYEGWRSVAPYLGVHWLRVLGDSADLARDQGDGVDELGLVVGFRIVY